MLYHFSRELQRRNIRKLQILLISCLLGSLLSCSSFRESPKNEFVDGIYKVKLGKESRKRLFILAQEDSTYRGYAVRRGYREQSEKEMIADSVRFQTIRLPLQSRKPAYLKASFSKISLDIDILTTLVKFRPTQASVPNQLNSSVNASVFLGQRHDMFRMKYARIPLGLYERKQIHYGISYGLFSGIGNTLITPTTTAGRTQLEYDGIVWQNGVAVIFGINTFTCGLLIGTDHLLNTDRKIWVYEQKPWVGVAVGLNLN